jgi:hypothetical protein
MEGSRHRSSGFHLVGLRGRAPIILAILLLTGLLALLGPAPTALAVVDPGSIAGTVTNHMGDPLPGIVVSVIRSPADPPGVVGEDVTDATGAYRVDNIEAYPFHHVRFTDPSGTYATEFYPDSASETYANWVAVTANTVTEGADATLELGASIAGRLTRVTGDPVVGSLVHLFGTSMHPVTDDTGHYAIEGIRPGTYVLQFGNPVNSLYDWEYWDDKPDFMSATPLVLAGGDALTGIDAVIDKPVRNLVPPTISGTARVGDSLNASPGTWTPPGIPITYRWVVGSDDVPGDDPTGPTYVPTVADVGQVIRVCAIGTAPGWPSVSASSSPTALVRPVAITYGVRPRVKGKLRVGQVVRVSHGVWKPSAVTLKYQWYLGGKAVTDATHRRLTLKARHVGKRLTVRVTAKAAGYTRLIVWTKPTGRVQP